MTDPATDSIIGQVPLDDMFYWEEATDLEEAKIRAQELADKCQVAVTLLKYVSFIRNITCYYFCVTRVTRQVLDLASFYNNCSFTEVNNYYPKIENE